jgi:hypothetical protein
MKALHVWLSGALLLTAAPAWAEPTTGDAACGQLMDEAAAGCVEVTAAEEALQELKAQKLALDRQLAAATTDAERDAANAKLTELQTKLTAATQRLSDVTDTPLEKLPGFCSSIDSGTKRDCDALATRLSAFDEGSLKDVNAATKAEELAKREALLQRAAASDRQTANNKSGASAQLEPVESIQPITVAGGALSFSGTRSGTKGVGTISVNPLALALPDRFDFARLMDLSMSAPFDLAGRATNQDPYVSTRLRINITGPFAAAELQKQVDAWLKVAGIYADDQEKALRGAKDVKRCAYEIAEHQRATVEACQQDVDSSGVRKAREQAYAAMQRARREADRYYLGLDARFDTGDPTGPAVEGDLGEHGLGGVAGGGRIPLGTRKLWDVELRGRAAWDIFKSRDPAASSHRAINSLDWGGAVILSGRLQENAKQRLAFGVGAEGRHAFSDSEEAKLSPTNYVKLNLMAVVPALTGGDVGLALGIPLWELREVRGVMATFSTDLGLLDHSL